jgi:flagellum-specific peptidoglycan hydrolase FlgJ
MKPSEFIKRFTPAAVQLAKKYDVSAADMLAQFAVESSWGASKFSQKYNNYTGMKATGSKIPGVWDGTKSVQDTTEEYKPGVISNIKSAFRVYSSPEQSMEDLAHRHAKRFNITMSGSGNDINKFIENVIASGYATGTGYHNLLNTIIDQYKLYDLDRGAKFRKKIIAKAGTGSTAKPKEITTPGASSGEKKK